MYLGHDLRFVGCGLLRAGRSCCRAEVARQAGLEANHWSGKLPVIVNANIRSSYPAARDRQTPVQGAWKSRTEREGPTARNLSCSS